LLYEPGTEEITGTQMTWFDRTGKTVTPLADRGAYSDPRVSPDGRRIAVGYGDPARDIWVIDSERGTKTRLTFDSAVKYHPSWSPDGKSVVYVANSTATGLTWQIRTKAANGAGAETVLLSANGALGFYPQWSPDGKYMLYLHGSAPTGWTLDALPLTGDRKSFTVLAPASPQGNITTYRVSADGRWVAYASNESGQTEVYVTSFPNATGKWQASAGSGGGISPAWRADGKKLYYVGNSDDVIYECDVTVSGDEVQISPPRPLFRAWVAASGTIDVAPDGSRFMINVSQPDGAAPMNLIVNWPAELKKK
jgi:eukaryotic-like serine/threonine-protein kinase